jgi:SnoaL-like domain
MRDSVLKQTLQRTNKAGRDMQKDSVIIVRAWQDAANHQNVEELLELSDPDIEIVGPRGSARGHQVLTEWLKRAGLHLETQRVFAKDSVVVMAQHGVWRSATNEVTGEAEVATVFRVQDKRVAYLARYDRLEEALQKANVSISDEVADEA